MRPRACNFLLALVQMKETCWSKLSSESIKIPSKVSFVLVVSEAAPIDNGTNFCEDKCLQFSRILLNFAKLNPREIFDNR